VSLCGCCGWVGAFGCACWGGACCICIVEGCFSTLLISKFMLVSFLCWTCRNQMAYANSEIKKAFSWNRTLSFAQALRVILANSILQIWSKLVERQPCVHTAFAPLIKLEHKPTMQRVARPTTHQSRQPRFGTPEISVSSIHLEKKLGTGIGLLPSQSLPLKCMFFRLFWYSMEGNLFSKSGTENLWKA